MYSDIGVTGTARVILLVDRALTQILKGAGMCGVSSKMQNEANLRLSRANVLSDQRLPQTQRAKVGRGEVTNANHSIVANEPKVVFGRPRALALRPRIF